MAYNSILFIHVLTGSVGLLSGLLAMYFPKFSQSHQKAGLLYFMSMLLCFVLAIVLSALEWRPFFFSIGIFSSYLLISGYLAIGIYQNRQANLRLTVIKVFSLLAIPISLWMCYPFIMALLAGKVTISVLAVFGLILILSAIGNLKTIYRYQQNKASDKTWLRKHISGMGGSYIAGFTAFAVNNIHLNRQWVVWLLPSLLGSIAIYLTIRKWDARFKKA